MEILQSIIATIGTITGGIIGWFISMQKIRRLKKVSNVIDSKEILDICSDKFKKEFVLPDFEENYFFLQTGIKTNKNSITKYIQLKDNLSKNFTWDDIKKAMPYLNIEEKQIKIHIDKIDRIRKNIINILALIIFILGILCSLYVASVFGKFYIDDYRIFILTTIIMSVAMFLMKALLHSVESVNAATRIEKRLNNVAQSD